MVQKRRRNTQIWRTLPFPIWVLWCFTAWDCLDGFHLNNQITMNKPLSNKMAVPLPSWALSIALLHSCWSSQSLPTYWLCLRLYFWMCMFSFSPPPFFFCTPDLAFWKLNKKFNCKNSDKKNWTLVNNPLNVCVARRSVYNISLSPPLCLILSCKQKNYRKHFFSYAVFCYNMSTGS